ncbi:hypothetical protein KSP35_08900 [Aquihabitans sp. G128]|uniref:hypothetical protein n=1 Tax=Aquihabitans sp. G128 TaxID=2849779 RepID=UPI001C21F6D7|nr:hypothetical protein [Aquihabitans sp. G128]QXC62879.1 hypothetical protein KSP35_08900 [Aquihabitans sp. G128]
MLPDGTYEAIVVDADDGPEPGTLRLELAIAAGPHRGEVLPIAVAGLRRDPLDLLAVPATVVVEGGAPRLTLEG